MEKYKPKHGDMEMWLICTAGETKREEMKNMKVNPDGTYTVKFEVGGVELDFSTVAKRIDESINALVESRAQKLLDSKYGSLLDEIYDIQERLENQKKDLFKHEWERENNNKIIVTGFGDIELEKDTEFNDSYLVKGNHFDDFKRDDCSQPHYHKYLKDDFINPADIEGVSLFEDELHYSENFWCCHKENGTFETFQEIAQDIPRIKDLLDNSTSLKDMETCMPIDNPLRQCINVYFTNKITVLYKNGYYSFLGDGRHRILAARAAKVKIPVRIIVEENK